MKTLNVIASVLPFGLMMSVGFSLVELMTRILPAI